MDRKFGKREITQSPRKNNLHFTFHSTRRSMGFDILLNHFLILIFKMKTVLFILESHWEKKSFLRNG